MRLDKGLVIGCILAVLALPLVGAVNDASAQNLILNGDFESGDLTNWEVFGQSATSDVTIETTDNGPTSAECSSLRSSRNRTALASSAAPV